MSSSRISPKNVLGLVDKVVGLNKEIVGAVVGNQELQRSGQRQQEAGTHKLEAIQEQGKAESARARAHLAEGQERAAQRSK